MFYIDENKITSRTVLHKESCAQTQNRWQIETTNVWHGPYETAMEGLDAVRKLRRSTNNVCPVCRP